MATSGVQTQQQIYYPSSDGQPVAESDFQLHPLLSDKSHTRVKQDRTDLRLNKAIVDGAPAQFLSMLRYKAAEAGIVYAEAPTRHVKPSQTCHHCGRVAKKPLAQRWHSCPCGATCSRDANAAWVLLDWGMQHVMSLFLAWLWLRSNRSQELTSYRGVQNLSLES
jgi:transposase